MPSTTAYKELAVLSHEERLMQLRSLRQRVASQPNDLSTISEALSALLAERIDALDHELGSHRP